MTAPSNASNGGKTTAQEAVQPKHGLSVLRDREAMALVSLVCDALSEVLNVAHEMHRVIYHQEATVGHEDLFYMRDDALACLSTSEHYLLMLGSVLEDQSATSGDLSDEPAPYPVYMTSAEATDGR